MYIFLIDAQVQNKVGDSEYGLYFAIFDFCFLFQIILDMGIQNYNSKSLSQNRFSIEDRFAYTLGTKVVLFFLFTLTTILVGYFLGYTLFHFETLLLVVLMMSLQVMYVYLRSHFSALGYFKHETLASALDKLLMIMFVGYFIYVNPIITIQLFLKAQIAALLISCLIVLIFLKKQFNPRIQFDVVRSSSLIKKSWPFAVVFLLMTLYTRMDGVMLEYLLDDEAISAGQYAKGFRLLDAANMIGYLFSVFLLPMFARLIGEKKNVNQLLSTAAKMQFAISSIITLVCWFYAADILAFIYKNITDQTIVTFKYLMVSFWAMSMSYIYGSLITASGQLKYFNLIFLIGIIINWSLNLWLIPRFEAQGAAIATMITQFFVFIGQYILANRLFSLIVKPLDGLKSLLLILSIMGLIIFFKESVALFWLIEIGLISGITMIISILFGFLRFNIALQE